MFAHLHVHTQFSVADATTPVEKLCSRVAQMGMTAVAITDHDNLHGAVNFALAAKKAGVKPIYGCCLSIAARPVGEHVLRVHHLTLLAENNVGYYNLLHLISHAHLQAPSGGKPRIDYAMLAAHSEGLICLSGDLSGEIANALLRSQPREAEQHIKRYMDIFGPQRFFLEVQDAGMEENKQLLPQLFSLADRHGLRCVATGDVHYLDREGAQAHAVLMCIGLGVQAPEDTDWLPTTGYYLADEAEMRRRFVEFPDAVDCAAEIAQRCNVELDLDRTYLPNFEVPKGHSIKSYFQKVARAGLQERFDEFDKLGKSYDVEQYKQRLVVEIGVIERMKFPGYFLIVWDFIRWAKEQGIPVGPGRGSGAGSLVAYALRITDIDPLPYNLLFERFLNEERVSMPDFDIDFCVKRRGEVIEYVAQKYGRDHVAQIATFGTLKAKAAIRDVGRVMGVPLETVNTVAKMVPNDPKMTIKKALADVTRLRDLAEQDPQVTALLETASQLEGATRNVGMHAAGVVISEKKLWEHVPLIRGAGGENVAQFAKDEVEKAGLVKFDFLGLKNLTMIKDCVELINQSRPEDEPFDISTVPLTCEEAYAVMSRGDTAGVFQMESSGFTAMIRNLRPSEFEDIIAAGALYRPGPLGMGMHTRYIQRKHGKEPVKFDHPLLEPILKETYGVIVYQEQVMQIARSLAGYSLGGADILRRAMGKKKPEVMDKQKVMFLEGASERGVDKKVAENIFSLMESFANYGFNKSHAAAYGLITYQTAYLKAHFRTEFFAALLTADKDDTDKVVQYLQEAKRSDIKVLPPDINASKLSFSVVDGVIRFGLGAIKGVGSSAVDLLIEARGQGKFKSLFDLCERVDMRRINRRVLEALVKCGALDCFGQTREVLWATISKAIERAQRKQLDEQTGQGSLFGLGGPGGGLKTGDGYSPATTTWTVRETLKYEKEHLGFYVTGHPLDQYENKLWRLDCQSLAACKDPQILNGARKGRARVTVGTIVVSLREVQTQKKTAMGILVIEDLSGQAEVLCFEPALSKLRAEKTKDAPLLLTLTAQKDRREEGKVALRLEDCVPLENEVAGLTHYLRIMLRSKDCSVSALKRLRQLLVSNGEGTATAPTAAGTPEHNMDQGDLWEAPDTPADTTQAPEDTTLDTEQGAAGPPTESEGERGTGDNTSEPASVEAKAEQEVAVTDASVDAEARPMDKVGVEFTIVVGGKGKVRVVARDLVVRPTAALIDKLEKHLGQGTVLFG